MAYIDSTTAHTTDQRFGGNSIGGLNFNAGMFGSSNQGTVIVVAVVVLASVFLLTNSKKRSRK